MRIGVTSEWIGAQAGGPERYLMNLLPALGGSWPDVNFDAYVIARPALDWSSALAPNISLRNVGSSRWSAIPFGVPREMRKRPVDLLHATYVAPPYCPRPFVLTVLDVGFETNPEFFPPGVRWRLQALMAWSVRRARAIVAISEKTRETLGEVYRINTDNVIVTPLAVDEQFTVAESPDDLEVRSQLNLPAHYLLYVGKLQARKNTAALVRAYGKLRKSMPDAPDLVLVGRRTWLSEETFAAIEQSSCATNIHVTGHVDDAALPAIYRGATLFVFPSLFEGFGFPLLEAMQSGVPVVSSNSSSLPEVGGDAVMYFDPASEDQMADTMKMVLCDDRLRQDLIVRGLARSATFRWSDTARGTLRAYERVLGT